MSLSDDDDSVLLDVAEDMWGVIANASGGNWDEQSDEWRDAAARVRDRYFDSLREFVSLSLDEIIRKCGDEWCLYAKRKGKNGKRRRLGTHPSRAAAERQERAIKSHGG